MKSGNELLEGSIAKTIYKVAAPTMINMFIQTSYHLVDAIWIGRLGSTALAAVSSASFFIWFIFSAFSIVEVGVNSLTARYYGAKDYDSLNKISFYGLRFGIILAFFISLISLPNLNYLFGIMKINPEVIDQSLIFLSPIYSCFPVFALTITTSAIFRGIGDTKTSLKILASTLILNIIIAPFFIFGIGSFQGFGISGGAIATIICEAIAALTNIIILRKRGIVYKISGRFLKKEPILKISKIGLPVALNGVIFCIIYIFLTKVVSQFGTESIAAIAIGQRVESVGYCIALGFSIAATTLIGQNIGAGNEDRAKNTVKQLLSYTGIVMTVLSILVFIFSQSIANIFTQDPKVISVASGFLQIIAYTQTFLAFEVVMSGVFSGMGKTLPPTLISLPLNLLRIPLAYYLADRIGIEGVWWSICLTSVIKGILLILWFKLFSAKSLVKQKLVLEAKYT